MDRIVLIKLLHSFVPLGQLVIFYLQTRGRTMLCSMQTYTTRQTAKLHISNYEAPVSLSIKCT